ncbi:phosphopantetheine-binding protein [Xenorhabdus sp. XENO-1]|uniref:phosphopantetheine-binding protein n=1 Tax=Xenorhabdus bovienii TaxID=40576 RepID=UPI0020CA5325|nr:phosphopantetheine-binding protein [Xenorhabdus bovienii]MCP9268400.1 phosphopantetheine-binding protein [Xenorhabdus bovienii subsp. africana]
MNKTLLLVDLSELLGVDITLLNDDYVLDSEGRWDSLAIVSVIGAINQHYAVQVNGEALGRCHQVGEIFNLVFNQNIMVVE